MTLQQKQQQLIEDFALFDDWEGKYEYLIDLGKNLPLIQPELKTEDRLVKGCQSRVWLNSDLNNGKLHFTADSDAIITKGIIALLVFVFNEETPADVVSCDMSFIKTIGLQEHLSPTRSNGLVSMINKMKGYALQHA